MERKNGHLLYPQIRLEQNILFTSTKDGTFYMAFDCLTVGLLAG